MASSTEASSAGDQCRGQHDTTVDQEVERALRGSSHCGLRGVQFKNNGGHVQLTGEVASFYLKQIAQTIVARLPAVLSVDNQLRVVGLGTNPWKTQR